jgi:hypothetical protein
MSEFVFKFIFLQVDVKFERELARLISLHELKHYFLQSGADNPLKNLALFKLARLSVSPLTDAEFDFILSLEHQTAPSSVSSSKTSSSRNASSASASTLTASADDRDIIPSSKKRKTLKAALPSSK